MNDHLSNISDRATTIAPVASKTRKLTTISIRLSGEASSSSW